MIFSKQFAFIISAAVLSLQQLQLYLTTFDCRLRGFDENAEKSWRERVAVATYHCNGLPIVGGTVYICMCVYVKSCVCALIYIRTTCNTWLVVVVQSLENAPAAMATCFWSQEIR